MNEPIGPLPRDDPRRLSIELTEKDGCLVLSTRFRDGIPPIERAQDLAAIVRRIIERLV